MFYGNAANDDAADDDDDDDDAVVDGAHFRLWLSFFPVCDGDIGKRTSVKMTGTGEIENLHFNKATPYVLRICRTCRNETRNWRVRNWIPLYRKSFGKRSAVMMMMMIPVRRQRASATLYEIVFIYFYISACYKKKN